MEKSESDRHVLTVIVNFNSALDCLNVIAELPRNYGQWSNTIVIVDNASQRSDVQTLALGIRLYSHVLLIESSENLGFGAGVNLATSQAGYNDFQFLQVLNCDISILDSQFTLRLINLLVENKNIGIVGPRVRGRHDALIQDTILPELNFRNSLFFNKATKQASTHIGDGSVVFVPGVNGVCFLCRMDAFRSVGGFDADYFMYVEESDLCRRLGESGWNAAFYCIESISHSYLKHGDSIDWKHAIIRRNLALHLRKQGRSFAALTLLVAFCSVTCGKWMFSAASFSISLPDWLRILLGRGKPNVSPASTFNSGKA